MIAYLLVEMVWRDSDGNSPGTVLWT